MRGFSRHKVAREFVRIAQIANSWNKQGRIHWRRGMGVRTPKLHNEGGGGGGTLRANTPRFST